VNADSTPLRRARSKRECRYRRGGNRTKHGAISICEIVPCLFNAKDCPATSGSHQGECWLDEGGRESPFSPKERAPCVFSENCAFTRVK
jgi:hypothetical protein